MTSPTANENKYLTKENPRVTSFYPLFFSLLFFLLIVFFVYGIFYQPSFFFFLTIILVLCMGCLIPYNSRVVKKQSEIHFKKQDYVEKSNLLKAEISSELKTAEAFRKKIGNYSKLKSLMEKLSRCFSLEEVSQILFSEVHQLFGSHDTTSILYIFHSQTGELGISSSQRGQMQINLKSKKGDIFDQWVVKTMQPLLIEDTRNDFRFDLEKFFSEEMRPLRSLISVPLIVSDKALGILRRDSPRENHFNSQDLRFLMTIGDLGAITIENAQLYERIEDLGLKDSLTGLYLRKHLLDRLTEELGRQRRGTDFSENNVVVSAAFAQSAIRKKDAEILSAKASKNELSFLMIDLDHFKEYNDRFGHMAGDIVLRTVAMILADHFSEPGNLVCRYGGEEFCVLLTDCPKQKAFMLAEEFRERLERQIIILRREKTHITVSIGVASFPKDAQGKEELIHLSDQAMYQAKQTGRNKVCLVH